VEEEVSKVDKTWGRLIGFALFLLVPRPNFIPKLNIPEELIPVYNTPIRVKVLKAPPYETRSIKELWEISEREAALKDAMVNSRLSDPINKLVGAAATAESDPSISSAFNLLGSAKNLMETAAESLPRPEPLPANTGRYYSVNQSSRAIGDPNRGTSSGSSSVPGQNLVDALRKNKTFKELEEYYTFLPPEQLGDTKEIVLEITKELRGRRLPLPDAIKKITTLLNHAKEVTGEYNAEVGAHSDYEILEKIRIPRRENGVPVLDLAYRVRDRATGEELILVIEAKGGLNTRLGKVTRKIITFMESNRRFIISEVKGETVRQATGEWYWQKIVELYELGMKSTDMRVRAYNISQAERLFEPARTGKLRSAIVKSGIGMDPYIEENTWDVVKFFKGMELPWKKPSRPQSRPFGRNPTRGR
jgi:hypothetical protein